MIELEIARHGLRLRVGRWHFRTWRSYVMKLPNGYRSPVPVYAVEFVDEDGDSFQLGVFFDLEIAEACRAQLEAEGRFPELSINYLAVHSRLKDWEWDR